MLCFVSNKFVKLLVKQLESILSDFYTVEVLTEAKVRLLSDIESMEASVQIPMCLVVVMAITEWPEKWMIL